MRIPVELRHVVRGVGGCRSWRVPRSALVRPSWRWSSSSSASPNTVTIDGRNYETDEWMNTPPTIQAAVSRRLHLQPHHPISLTRRLIESRFPSYESHNTLSPIVGVAQNFDSLGFPADHVGRSRTDTYYINKSTVLRTHTSAHQADTFRANASAGYLISADVYRRDAVDRSHYPVFHQMEGARTWDRTADLEPYATLAEKIWADVEALPKHDIKVEDPNPTFHAERNPLQAHHSAEEVEAIAAHLKRSLENVVVDIFARAAAAAASSTTSSDTDAETPQEPLRVRWVEAYFPFTSPSWELEVWWQGDWLEVLGCGIVQQPILSAAGVPQRVGWAFGLGLERIAMLLFQIPDIRLFWSRDERFLGQFVQGEGGGEGAEVEVRRFVPFSKYPPTQRDVAFWLSGEARGASAAGGLSPPTPSAPAPQPFHENDIMELVRAEAGDVVEDVRLIDSFTHPKTGRRSLCYRIVYRSLERTLTNEEANAIHERIRERLVGALGVVLR